MKKWVAWACTALLLAAVVIGCAEQKDHKEADPEYVFTYAENQADDYPTTMGGKKFAQLVKEKTNGKIVIQIKAGAQFGDEKSVIEQMRFGGIDFTRASLTSMADLIPEMNILQMPYLYEDSSHMWRVLDGKIGQEFLGFFTAVNLVGLSWYDAGARSFYSKKKAIRSIEDIRGLTVRVQDAGLMKDFVKALGGIPYTNEFSGVYSAFETDLIDAAENNWPSYESAGHYRVAKYFTVDEHTRVPEVQLMSWNTWDKLSHKYQEIIQECARESAEYERELWEVQEAVSQENVLEYGCRKVILQPEELEKFQKAVESVYEKYCSEYMDIIEEIRAAGRS